jgi:hypothetical protein
MSYDINYSTTVIVAGAPGHSSGEGKIFVMDGGYIEGACLDILTSLVPRNGALFGSALSGSSDGLVIVGAPEEDVASNAEQGRVYLYSLTDRDEDVDGLYVGMEIYLGTDPYSNDTDGDTWYDGEEVMYGTDPLDPESFPEDQG